jgi:hypothetical protein
MKDTFRKPRSKVCTAFVMVAPSAILVVGVWFVCIAAFLLAEDPFEPNWIIVMGGIVVVVGIALATIVLTDRSKATSKGHDRQLSEP